MKKIRNKSDKKLDQIYQSVVHAKQYREPEREPRYYLVNISSSHFVSVEKGKDLKGREYYMDELLEGVYDPLTIQDLTEIKEWIDSNSNLPFLKTNFFILQLSLREAMSCMLSDISLTRRMKRDIKESFHLSFKLDELIRDLMDDTYCIIPNNILNTILQYSRTNELSSFYYRDGVAYALPTLKMELTFAYLRFLTNIIVKREYISPSDETSGYVPYTCLNIANPNTVFLMTQEEKDKYFFLPISIAVASEKEKDECEEKKTTPSGEFSREDYLEFVSEKANRQYEIYTIEYIMSQIVSVADRYVKLKGGSDHSDMFNISYEGGESISIALWNIDLSDKKTPSITINLQREPEQQPLIQIEFEEVNSVLALEYLSDNYYLLDDKYCLLAKDFVKEDNLRNIFDRLIWQRHVNNHQ